MQHGKTEVGKKADPVQAIVEPGLSFRGAVFRPARCALSTQRVDVKQSNLTECMLADDPAQLRGERPVERGLRNQDAAPCRPGRTAHQFEIGGAHERRRFDNDVHASRQRTERQREASRQGRREDGNRRARILERRLPGAEPPGATVTPAEVTRPIGVLARIVERHARGDPANRSRVSADRPAATDEDRAHIASRVNMCGTWTSSPKRSTLPTNAIATKRWRGIPMMPLATLTA